MHDKYFLADRLHEIPCIRKKDHADSCSKNMHSNFCWLLAILAMLSTDPCVWPLETSHLTTQVNYQSLSQNITSGKVGNGVQFIAMWFTYSSPRRLLLGYSTSTLRNNLLRGKRAGFLYPQFPSALRLLSSIVNFLISQKWKGNSKTKWGERLKAGLKQEHEKLFLKMNHLFLASYPGWLICRELRTILLKQTVPSGF